jgi:hypothetical protein
VSGAKKPARRNAFQPTRKFQGLEKYPEVERALLEQFNALKNDLASMLRQPDVTGLKTRDYFAHEEEVVRCAPGSDGMTLLLPRPRPDNRGSVIVVLLESVELNNLVVQVVGVTINGQSSLTFSNVGRHELQKHHNQCARLPRPARNGRGQRSRSKHAFSAHRGHCNWHARPVHDPCCHQTWRHSRPNAFGGNYFPRSGCGELPRWVRIPTARWDIERIHTHHKEFVQQQQRRP